MPFSSILSNSNAMKPLYVYLLLLCITPTIYAQSKGFASFQDYFVINTNPDSLEKVIYAHRGNTTHYLHHLLWLEYSRYKVSDHFGNDLTTIQKLVSQQRVSTSTAMYNYIMGMRYKSENAPKAFSHFQKALDYFEQVKDTSGLAHCHLALMRLNIDNFNERIGDIQEAKFHYDRMVELVQKSSDERNKISLMPRYLAEHDLFYKVMPLSEVVKEYDKILQLIKKHPEMKFMLKDVYLNLSFFYILNKDYETAVEKLKLSLKNSSYCSPYNQITIYSNLAGAYEGLGNYVEMEKCFKRILEADSPKIQFHEYVRIEANYGMALSILQKRKIGGVIPYLDTYNLLNRAYTERLKIKELLILQTKYETEKKEATIKSLEDEKQDSQNRSRLVLGGLGLAVFIIGVIGFLALRLRKINTELHSVQQSRDRLYTVIAHDLREPINSMTRAGTLLRYLIRQNLNDEVETVTQQLDLMGQQTSLLLNNLLEWGKSNYFDQVSLPEDFDGVPLLKELTQVYKVLGEAKGIEVVVNVPSHYPITANSKDFALIVRNLLDNALKNTPRGGKVELSVTANATIEVRDNGTGFAPDQLAYLQQVFAGKLKPEIGTHGLGLGLVLINDFTKKNGATLRLSSQEGKGTVFSLVMPN